MLSTYIKSYISRIIQVSIAFIYNNLPYLLSLYKYTPAHNDPAAGFNPSWSKVIPGSKSDHGEKDVLLKMCCYMNYPLWN